MSSVNNQLAAAQGYNHEYLHSSRFCMLLLCWKEQNGRCKITRTSYVEGTWRINKETRAESAFFQVPYEILNKKFRTAQKTLDREVSHVQQTATEIEKTLNDASDVRANDITQFLGGMVEKLQVLKRKAEESISEELTASNVCKRRLEHLKEHATIAPNGEVSQGALNQWRRKRLDRMVVEYFLRNGHYNAAITLAERSEIKELTNIGLSLFLFWLIAKIQ